MRKKNDAPKTNPVRTPVRAGKPARAAGGTKQFPREAGDRAALSYPGSACEPGLELTSLLRYDRVIVQCPDIPTADTLAAAWGLFLFFKTAGKRASLYSARAQDALSPNVREMVTQLALPLADEVPATTRKTLLIRVAGRSGSRAYEEIPGDESIVVGIRAPEAPLPESHDLRPYLSSCSTLVWLLLQSAGFHADVRLGTALAYGLYTETNGYREIRFPLDRDMRDMLPVDARLFAALERSNLSLADLAVTARALDALDYHAEGRFVLVNVLPCDPGILAFIGDLAMRVASVDSALVFTETGQEFRFRAHSAVREIRALDLCGWLAGPDMGTSGGDAKQAGGVISAGLCARLYPGLSVADFFLERMRAYLAAYDIVEGEGVKTLTAQGARAYQKRPVSLGYARCADLPLQSGMLHIRMLEGDIIVPAAADTLLMIGLDGEVYPIKDTLFQKRYTATDETLQGCFLYEPVVIDTESGLRVPLLPHAKICTAKEDRVLAHRLERGIKLFTRWDDDNYLLGNPGDWLVQIKNDPGDLYIIKDELFPRLYAPVRKPASSEAG